MRACAEEMLRGCPQATACGLLLLDAVRRGGVGVGAGGGGASNYNGVREIGGGGSVGNYDGARGGLNELLPHLGAALRAAARPLAGGGGGGGSGDGGGGGGGGGPGRGKGSQ